MVKVFRCGLLLVLSCVLLLRTEVANAAPEPLTEAKARELLPAAASMDPFVLHQIIELGGNVSPNDLRKHGPLTALFLVLHAKPAWPPRATKEFRFPSNATVRDFYSALYGGTVPKEPHASQRPTLLHANHLQSVTVEQSGDTATGVATFQAGTAYEGVVHFDAKFQANAWRITAFEFPLRGARVERRTDAWHLVTWPLEIGANMLSIVHFGRSNTLPTPRLTVRLRGQGEVTLNESLYDLGSNDSVALDGTLAALRKQLMDLVEAGAREPDATSALHLILVAEASARWKYAQWILQMAAATKIYRIHFAVQAINAKEPGLIEVLLPKDSIGDPNRLQATSEHPDEGPVLRIKLFRRNWHQTENEHYTLVRIDTGNEFFLPKGWPARRTDKVQAAAYHAALQKIRVDIGERVKSAGVEVRGEIVAPPPKGGYVPIEDVLNVLAMLRDAGVSNVTLEGHPMPLSNRERAALPKKK